MKLCGRMPHFSPASHMNCYAQFLEGTNGRKSIRKLYKSGLSNLYNMVEDRKICSKCDKLIKDDPKFCPSCGGKVVEEEDQRVKNVKRRRLRYFLIPSIIFIIIAAVVIFAIPFSYKATEAYNEQVPYTDTEYYYEREPYTVCAGTSFWTGNCNEWITEYENVRKSRTVNKYTTIQKERGVWKKDTLFNMWTGKTQYWFTV